MAGRSCSGGNAGAVTGAPPTEQHDDDPEERDGVAHERRGRACPRYQDARQRRADGARDVDAHSVEGHGCAEVRLRDQIGHNGVPRRARERGPHRNEEHEE